MELFIPFLRLSLTVVASFLYGLYRQRFHKPISFGTFILVSTGSCALALTAMLLLQENPVPLLSAIVTGIGFLGAGALIRVSDKISGFTSAATIWAFAIFGLLLGLGNYFIGFSLFATICLVTLVDRYFEKRGLGSYQRKITVNTNKIIDSKELDATLGKHNHKLSSLDLNKKTNTMTLIYVVEGTKEELNQVPKALFKKEWFDSFKIE